MTTKLIVVAGFLVAFAAGMVTGSGRREVAMPRVENPPGLWIPTTGPSSRPQRQIPPTSIFGFAREMNLNTEQREAFARIWDGTNVSGREMEDNLQKARQERDKRILDLVRAESRPQMEQILKDYTDQVDKLNSDWRTAYNHAVEESKKFLNSEQQAKWDEILARIQSGRGRRGSGPGGWGDGRGPGRRGGPQRGFEGSDRQQRGGDGRPENRAASRPATESL